MKKHKTKVPFLSSERRTLKKEITIITPGPGQYKFKGIDENVKNKVWGKQGVFGSTEKRFPKLSTLVIY